MIIFLDSNILGLIDSGSNYEETLNCTEWFYRSYARGCSFTTSYFCLYEVRRGLLVEQMSGKRAQGLLGLAKLEVDGFLDFTEKEHNIDIKITLEKAATLWAEASANGRSSRSEKDIDVDIIIAAQYQILVDQNPGQQVIVATKNLKHLSRFCNAANWQDINF
jgi:hypothetical protein